MNQDPQDIDYLKTLTVLHVEDDPLSQVEIGLFLERRVGRLIFAPNGAEGILAFQAQRPHIVVTDIQMPKMDGLSMVQEIRRIDPAVPVIATTAFEQTSYLMRSIDLGVDRYVVKPIQGELLEAALLACAHRLLVEHEARKALRLEQENAALRHQAALRILFGGLAHDFNNLLQGILNGISIAELEVQNPAAVLRALERTEGTIAQFKQLNGRLLTLGSATDGLPHISPLEETIRRGVSQAMEGSAIRVEFALGGKWAVKHDPMDLTMVFQNLVTNARESMGAEGVLRISTTLEEIRQDQVLGIAAGSYVRVRVEDSGDGIPEDILPMIFEPYFSTKMRGGQRGMGLSLSLCETIVRAHGGSIAAESKQGQGAVIVLHLPLAPDPEASDYHLQC